MTDCRLSRQSQPRATALPWASALCLAIIVLVTAFAAVLLAQMAFDPSRPITGCQRVDTSSLNAVRYVPDYLVWVDDGRDVRGFSISEDSEVLSSLECLDQS